MDRHWASVSKAVVPNLSVALSWWSWIPGGNSSFWDTIDRKRFKMPLNRSVIDDLLSCYLLK
jgi:hypothetical protein